MDVWPVTVATIALESEIEECQHRLLNREMHFAAASAAGNCSRQGGATKMAVAPFLEAFDSELRRVSDALYNLLQSAESIAAALLKDANGLMSKSSRKSLDSTALAKELARIKSEGISLQGKVIRLKQTTRHNADELTRIAMEAEAKLGISVWGETERYFQKEPWTDDVSSGNIVIFLSDIFSIVRDIENSEKEKGGEGWVAPSSFERVTTKYWVQEQSLPEVLLKSVSELPLLVYGRTGLLNENPMRPSKEDLWASMASPITSIYFDSPNLDLYKERIKRSEGAKLFRVRWYGNKPKGNESIFLELKTHHECWVDNKSVKERVTIKERNMPKLIDTSDGMWSLEYAIELVKEASPNDKEESIQESAALLLEIRSLFCELKLRPCVRTKYTRCAFQSSKNNNLRLTLDRDITVIDEACVVQNKGSWCLDDLSVVPMDAFVKVPYGVFEVKVAAGEDPIFIEELQQSGAIVKAPKFSKFLTGCALHNANIVSMLPWWSEDPLFAPLFKKQRRSSVLYRAESTSHLSQGHCNKMKDGSSSIGIQVVTKNESVECANDKWLNAAEEGSSKWGLRERQISPKSKEKSHPAKPIIASRTPARVEPKSFFANERTFIQWISAAVLLMTAAELLLVASSTFAVLTWNFLMSSAVLITLYGIVTYHRRLHLMINSKPYGYADVIGPTCFAIFIIIGFFLTMWWTNKGVESLNPPLKHKDGVCVQRYLGGNISYVAFEPSDIIVDEQRNKIIVASLNEIVSIPDGIPLTEEENNVNVTILHRFLDRIEDIEALEIMEDGTILAVSEKGRDGSEIIELEWDAFDNDDLLKPTARHKISTPRVEGIAIVHDNNFFFDGHKLIVAGMDNTLIMNTFPMPLPESSSLENPANLVASRMNNNLFGANLLDVDTKVSAMQFFDGILYLLFDNAQVIRAFDHFGNMIQETKLPIPVKNFEKQWEGMRFQRKNGDLILHLALDTPPQIWSIKLEENTGSGLGWKLPSCAS